MTHTTCDRRTEEILSSVARAATTAAARVATSITEPLEHRVENMTTARLDRVRLTLDDGTTVSVVAKTLRPASAAPAFAAIPPEHHQQVLEDLHWLDEPDVFRSGLGAALPEPLRMPTVHLIDDASEPTHITVWMEDVDDVVPWTLDRYRRTATALGALAGRWTGPEAATTFGLHERPLARLFNGKITHLDLPLQAGDDFWADPHVSAAVDDRHRADLARLAEAVPGLLDRLPTLPSGVCHGDATPDNFREPGDGAVVALDWSYGHVGAVGSDLAQLLVGRFESGAAESDQIASIAATILDGFMNGLAAEGAAAAIDQVRAAWATHLAVRSAFSALVLDHRPDLDSNARADLLRRRAAVARFGLDLALDVAET